jgi:hypothetical protein
MTLITITF